MVVVAVVGAGNWGRNLVRNFASLSGVQLKYVCDRSEKVRQSMAAQYPRAEVVADLDGALKDPELDAVAAFEAGGGALPPDRPGDLYGDGKAAERIVALLAEAGRAPA